MPADLLCSTELLGFDSEGKVVNFDSNGVVSLQEVCERSSKIINFIDFPGHQRVGTTSLCALFACVLMRAVVHEDYH